MAISRKRVRRSVAALASAGIIAAGMVATSAGVVSGHPAKNPWTWPGTAKKGYLPSHEPDIHGGKVKIGLISAGTIHDHGYYQSEVTVIDAYASKYHWTTIVQGKVATADALSDAENMCSQGVDLLIIGESQLAAATPAAMTSVCKDTPVWIFSAPYVPLTKASKPYLHIATTTGSPSTVATGVAMGLWMKAHHQTVAGFVTGPALSFTEGAAQGYLAGMQYVTKHFSMDAAFTGTLTASGPAVTAATAMIAKGIKMIFPYLGGGALFSTAKYVTSHGGTSPSDGGKWCERTGVKFSVEEVYNPGYLLAPALTEFAHGTFRVGVSQLFAMGVTAAPSVSFCPSAGVSMSASEALTTFIKAVETHKITATALVKKTPIPK
ncbi:MAG TPA: BMP family ABC transporter substrate-binding protein [Acidimicrobiales bacterium]|nr:BMP family ABC transporter substrate-binding protein [Acidimicrobiales bacterium]